VDPFSIEIPETRARSKLALLLLKLELEENLSESEAELVNNFLSSIRENSIQEPITVIQTEKGYMLAHGEARLRAAIRLNLKDVPVRTIGKGTEVDAVKTSLITSVQSEADPIELALTIDRLQREGIKAADIAKMLGRSKTMISMYSSLIELDLEVKDRVRRGELGILEAYYITQINNPTYQRKLARIATDNKWDRDRILRFVQTYKEIRETGVPADIAYQRAIKKRYAWLRRGTYCDFCHSDFPEGERGILLRLCEVCYKKVYEGEEE